jgi:hypothetical protein
VPRILDAFLEAVVYLYPSTPAARDGEQVGGTGFLIAYKSDVDERTGAVYAVTNSHVIREGGSPVIRINLRAGGFDTVPLEPDDWHHHPDGDDIAVVDLGSLDFETYHYSLLDWKDMALTQERVNRHNIGPGDEVCFVGRFKQFEGRARNLPTARFGNIAMMPIEPVRNERGIDQEAFLVEARSLSGFSGSPVFVIIPPLSFRGSQAAPGLRPELHMFVLGVDWGHHHDRGRVLDQSGDSLPEGWFVSLNSGIMTVVPAWRITAMLEAGELADTRRKRDERWVAEHKKTSNLLSDNASPGSDTNTF